MLSLLDHAHCPFSCGAHTLPPPAAPSTADVMNRVSTNGWIKAAVRRLWGRTGGSRDNVGREQEWNTAVCEHHIGWNTALSCTAYEILQDKKALHPIAMATDSLPSDVSPVEEPTDDE